MPAERDQQNFAPWLALCNRARGLEPAGDSAASLPSTLPPAAARRAHDDRRELRIGSRHGGNYIRCPCRDALDARDQERLRALGCEPLQRGGLRARYLQHRRTRGLEERNGVEQVETGHGAACQYHDALVIALSRLGHGAALLALHLQKDIGIAFDHRDVRVAAERAETTANPVLICECGVEHRKAIDASLRGSHERRLRIDPIEREFLEARLETDVSKLGVEPERCGDVAGRRGPMVALRVVGLDHRGDSFFHGSPRSARAWISLHIRHDGRSRRRHQSKEIASIHKVLPRGRQSYAFHGAVASPTTAESRPS